MVKVNNRIYTNQPREFPGSIRVEKLTISGTDVSDYYQQIDVFESIYSPTMSARLTLLDTTNLIKKIPIIGEEVVEIWLNDGIESCKHKFICHKLSDRQSPRHGVLKYVLHLVSEEKWTDSYTKVSKSYNLKKFEDNVKDILTGSLFLNSKKPLISGVTKQPECVLIPNWSPIFAINWMGNRARADEDSYRGGDFLFYETMDGFKWVAIDNLLDDTANIPYGTVSYDPLRPSQDGLTRYDSRTKSDVMRFEQWDVVKTFDTLENTFAGLYANKTRVVDIVERDFSDEEFSYIETFYDHKHLKSIEGFSAKPLCSFENKALQSPDAHSRVVVKHKGLFDDEPEGSTHIDEWLPKKISKRQQLESFKVRGQLPGHIGLTAGMILNFYFPNPEDISVNDRAGYDPSYSGQYLVTSLRRMIQRDKFNIIVDMVKDSRGQDPNKVVSF